VLQVRHGRSPHNRDGEEAGPNGALTALDRTQAHRVADRLAKTQMVDLLYGGPTLRACAPAEVIGEHLQLTVSVPEGF